jgi:hypothetical protein
MAITEGVPDELLYYCTTRFNLMALFKQADYRVTHASGQDADEYYAV